MPMQSFDNFFIARDLIMTGLREDAVSCMSLQNLDLASVPVNVGIIYIVIKLNIFDSGFVYRDKRCARCVKVASIARTVSRHGRKEPAALAMPFRTFMHMGQSTNRSPGNDGYMLIPHFLASG